MSLNLKNVCANILSMKIRCNHVHKLMEITDRSAARYMIEKITFLLILVAAVLMMIWTSNTTPPKRRQWFLRLKNTTLKNIYDVCMMDHPCKICVHNVCLPINFQEDNCWSTIRYKLKLFRNMFIMGFRVPSALRTY